MLTFLKALRTLRNAELPDTRPSDWFFGAKRLANQSFDRQIDSSHKKGDITVYNRK
jgi:hypothetical protein